MVKNRRTDRQYNGQKRQIITKLCSTCWSALLSFPHSWPIDGFVTRATRRVNQELLALPEHLSSPAVFTGVRVTRSVVLYAMLCRSLFVLISFYFDHCVGCPSSIYGFWLSLWYLQNLPEGYTIPVPVVTLVLHSL
jgi:hypothetical protein